MNLVVMSGIVQAPAKVQSKPGFCSLFFSIENTTGYKDYKRTQIINVKKMGKKDSISKYLVKDRYVTVTGELVEETFQKNNVTQKLWVINARDVELGGQKKDESNQTADSPYDDSTDSPAPAEDENPFGA
jgi:hypothetical protein